MHRTPYHTRGAQRSARRLRPPIDLFRRELFLGVHHHGFLSHPLTQHQTFGQPKPGQIHTQLLLDSSTHTRTETHLWIAFALIALLDRQTHSSRGIILQTPSNKRQSSEQTFVRRHLLQERLARQGQAFSLFSYFSVLNLCCIARLFLCVNVLQITWSVSRLRQKKYALESDLPKRHN
jgi:hypothetical protein